MNSFENEKKHNVILKNKEELEITGVNKLVGLNSEEFMLDTVCGGLCVRGSLLEMVSLDSDNGIIHIKGNVNSIEYQSKGPKVKEKSFLAKVFR